MTDSLSASDILAITKNSDGGMGDAWNNPFIYLVWLALLGNGGIFGNNTAATSALTATDLTNAITNGNTNQDIFRNFGNLDTTLNSFERQATQSWGDIRYDMATGFNGTNSQIAENRYAMQNGFCSINRNIDDVKAEAYQNTCAITQAIHSEGEATRALIQSNTIQALRDKLEDKDRELLSANFLISQANQNATLIDALKPVPIPAYTVASPYSYTSTY